MIETEYLQGTRGAYDSVAELYAEMFSDSLRDRPLERAMLAGFAELVRADGASDAGNDPGSVADLGCGPGYVTAYLNALGLSAFGVDLSPTMVGLARKAHPELRFEEGSMTALGIADGTLGGVLSRFSIIHTPPEIVPGILAEFQRVLAPGGHLLISFPGSEGPAHPTQSYDHRVALAYRWWPDHFAELLREAGLEEQTRMVQKPEPEDKRQFLEIHILARRA